MSNWFEPVRKTQTINNIEQNKRRCIDLITLTFNDPYKNKIDTVEEFNELISNALTMYKPSVVLRIVGTINKSFATRVFPLRAVKRRLNALKAEQHSNYISNDDFALLMNNAVDMLRANDSPNDEQTRYFCVFLLCALYGLRLGDADRMTSEDLRFLLNRGQLVIETQKTRVKQNLVCDSESKRSITRTVLEHLERLEERRVNKVPLSTYFTRHYESVLGRPKEKQIGFHALRFRFSKLGECEDAREASLVEFTTKIKDAEKSGEMGHSRPAMTKYYQRTQQRNDLNNNERQQNLRPL